MWRGALALLVACSGTSEPADPGARVRDDVKRLSDDVADIRKGIHFGGDPHDRAWVEATVRGMARVDQLVRGRFGWPDDNHYDAVEREYFQGWLYFRMLDVDDRNLAELRRILAVHGWLGEHAWGGEIANDCWLLVQHADRDPYFQREVLDRVAPLVATGDIRPQDFALLYDRVALAEGKPQRYGSQVDCRDHKRAPIEPVEDLATIDARRAGVHLGAEADYLAGFSACP